MNKLMNKNCYIVYFVLGIVFGNFESWVKIILAISTTELLANDLLVNII